MKIEKIHTLYNLAAKRKRSLDDLRHDILVLSREIYKLQASRQTLKTAAVLKNDHSQLAHVQQQLADLEQPKTEMLGRAGVLEAEFKETTKLREACERWLEEREIEVPQDTNGNRAYVTYV
jgi:hypothetical protein